MSQGEKAWQISASNNKLGNPQGSGRTVPAVSGLRPQADVPIQDSLLVAAALKFKSIPGVMSTYHSRCLGAPLLFG